MTYAGGCHNSWYSTIVLVVITAGVTHVLLIVLSGPLLLWQLYELAASGVRERAKLRQELNEMQAEMQVRHASSEPGLHISKMVSAAKEIVNLRCLEW
jgi:hypothetical protein